MSPARGRQAPSWRRDTRGGQLALVGAAAVLFVVVAAALVFSPALDGVDAGVSTAIRRVGGGAPGAVAVARALTFLGSSLFVTTTCVLVGVWLLARRRFDAVVYLVCSVAGGWLVATALKHLIGRARPVGVNLVPLPNEPSLPSGHTVASALMCGAIAVILVLNVRSAAAKKWALALGLAIPVLVGLSRVYLGVHWFGDVLAGWLYAAAWWGICTSVYLGVVARRQGVVRQGQGARVRAPGQ